MYSTCVKSRTFTLVVVLQDTALADWPVRLPSDSFIACLVCFQIAWILAWLPNRTDLGCAHLLPNRTDRGRGAVYSAFCAIARVSVIRKGPYIPIDPNSIADLNDYGWISL